jgi:hypothetical protein
MTMEEARQQVKEFIGKYGIGELIVDYLSGLPADRLRSESVQLAILALRASDLAEMQLQVEISSNTKLSNFHEEP